VHVTRTRKQHNGDTREHRILKLLGTKLPSIHDGHHEIQQDQRRHEPRAQDSQRIGPMVCNDDVVAFIAKQLSDICLYVFIVFDNQKPASLLLVCWHAAISQSDLRSARI